MLNSRNTSSGSSTPSYAAVEKINCVFPMRGPIVYHPYDNFCQRRDLQNESQRPPTPPPDYTVVDPQYEDPVSRVSEGTISSSNPYAMIDSPYPEGPKSTDSSSSLISNDSRCPKCLCNKKYHLIFISLLVLLAVGSILLLDATNIIDFNIFPNKFTGDETKKTESNPILECKDMYTFGIGESSGNIECFVTSNISIGSNDTIIMRKTGLNDSDTLMKALEFKESHSNGKVTVEFLIFKTVCSDEGNYSISLNTSDIIHDIHRFSIFVQDSPDRPSLEKKPGSRGYIAGETLNLQCKATIGCKMKELLIKRTPQGITSSRIIEQGRGNYTIKGAQYEQFELTLDFSTMLTHASNGDGFTCDIEGTDRVSDVYQVATVPVDYCNGKTVSCDYRHPSRCDMWVICETEKNPVIQTCGPSMYYKPATDCECCVQHECVIPQEAGCPYD